MRAATIVDIAREAGVSFKTVSRVINGEANVRPETHAKVQAAIVKLDFRPNVWARALASSRSHLVGLLYDNPSPGYVTQVQVGAMTACQHGGYHLVIEAVRCGSRNLGADIGEFLASVKLDGVVLSPPVSDNATVMDALERAGTPYVRIAPYKQIERTSYVTMDDYRAAYDMTAYLLSLGHRDIAFIQGPRSHAAASERYRGFLTAMKEQGGHLEEDWRVRGGFTARSGMDAAERLLRQSHRPTAIFAGNDDMAIGAVGAAFRKGLTLPADLSIVGFDDSPVASSLWPPLTTVRQPVSKMAEAATEMLINHLRARGKAQARVLNYEIIERESVQPLHCAA